jgi:hypothetical protein
MMGTPAEHYAEGHQPTTTASRGFPIHPTTEGEMLGQVSDSWREIPLSPPIRIRKPVDSL